MVKEKRILSYFIGWLLIGCIIMFVGINKTFASTYYMNYQYQQKYYDNYGSSVSAVSTNWMDSFNSYVSDNITTVAGSYGAGLSITSPIPIIRKHTYAISIYFEETNNIALSSKSNIAISTSLNGAAYNYASNDFWAETLQSKVNNNTILQFVFTADGNATYIFIPWTTTSTITQNYVLTEITMEDLGSEGLSQDDINTSLNNQTSELNNSIQESTNTITDKIDDMEQSIVDSNKETQEVIKEQFNSCKNSTNLFNLDWFTFRTTNGVTAKLENDHILLNGTSTGNVYFNFNIPSGSFDTTNPLYWHLKSDVNLSNFQIQRSNLNVINIVPTNSWSTTLINNDSSYNYSGYLYIAGGITLNNVKLYISVTKEKEFIFEPFGEEICTNKLDDTNDKLNGIQGALTDSSTPNLSGLENSIGWLPPGPVDSILNLPLTMLNSLTNSLTKTCTPLNLTLPYVNKNIQIPCLSAIFAQITGVNGLWTWVGTIASILILYNYLLNLYAWVDKVLTLRAEFDEAMGADLANWGRL